MENILRGLADGQLAQGQKMSETLKKQLLQKVLISVPKRDRMEYDEASGLFRLFLEWILLSEKPILVDFGHKFLGAVSQSQPDLFHEFVSPNMVIEMFNNAPSTNRVEVVATVDQILRLLKMLPNERSSEQRRSVVNVTKAHLFMFLKEHGIHLPVSAAISTLYQNHPEVLPNASEWPKLALLVVKLLAGYRHPNVRSSEEVDEEEEDAFVRDTAKVSLMLPLVWGRSDDKDGVEGCLKAFYAIISTDESDSKPSCALVHVVDKIPHQFLELAAKSILLESGQQQGEAKTVVALQTMMDWLTQIPGGKVLSDWLQHILHNLQRNDKNSILIEIAHSCTEKLLLSLPDPSLRPYVEPMFFFVLLGFQHSESVFHSLVTRLPQVLKALFASAQSSVQARTTMGRLGEAAHYLMIKFPNFPELYDPVIEVLQELGIHPPGESRQAELRTLSWLSTLHTTTFANHQGDASAASPDGTMMRMRKRGGSIVDETLAYRSETGMVGLINLGNTCYMNSVLQALFISKDFRERVLHATLTGSQSVMFRLQMAFTFLKLSQRSIYSPAELLKAAKPPWFENGRQQDCSEFLRYLLDTLHEQERNGAGGKAAVVYGEHKIIESASVGVTTGAEEDEVAIKPASLNVIGGGQSAKVSSASNLALDVISEAPENEEKRGGGDEDEEMLSQDGRTDEDYFGSRGSLTASTPCAQTQHLPLNRSFGSSRGGSRVTLNMEEDEDDDADLAGSRTSLGSGGLKRWTTEENLSSNGSREGKIDLLDGSHSNSTDSGIQSVGDTIPGDNNPQPMDTSGSSSNGSLSRGQQQQQQQSFPFVSLVQQVFGGKMQTSYTCYACRSVSQHRDIFTELHLAIPEKTVEVPKKPEVKAAESDTKKEESSSNATTPTADDLKLPPISDLIPKEKPAPWTMDSLVVNYLAAEVLQDDNKYHCDKCGGLRDAEKNISILEGPEYLLCTLLRFKYDRTVNRKSKVFTDVDYQLELELPLYVDGEEGKRSERYSLYAIVVHSGYSSDGGHYYTYAREPKEGGEGEEEDDEWYIFNDSKVSFATFESFKTVSKRFPRDAAYQLFYRKMGQRRKGTEASLAMRRPLRGDLRSAVEKDNVKFLREKERSATTLASSSSNLNSWQQRRDDDDKGGGGGCGGGGFNSGGGRLVC